MTGQRYIVLTQLAFDGCAPLYAVKDTVDHVIILRTADKEKAQRECDKRNARLDG